MSQPEQDESAAQTSTRGISRGNVAAVLGIIAIVVLGAALFGSLWEKTPDAATAPPAIVPTTETTPAPQGTLGIRFDEVRPRWNEVTSQPEIVRVLRRTPEAGQFDSFFHRFDAAANISGAYRDGDEYLVAIKVDVGLGHPDVATIHLHLCHLVSPFSPECLQSFQDTGLSGLSFEELRDSGVSTTWTFGDNEWRLNEDGGVLTIRVLAPTPG